MDLPFLIKVIALPRQKLLVGAILAVGITKVVSELKNQGNSTSNAKKEASSNTIVNSREKKDPTQLKKTKGGLWSVLKRVLGLAIGNREKMNLLALTLSLFLRTGFSIYISQHLGNTIGYFCEKDWKNVNDSVKNFAKYTILASLVNSALHMYTDVFNYNMRETLTKKAHALYKQRMNFYNVNWVGPDILENTDQLIAEDIAKFSDAASEVYTQSLKPLVDFILFSLQLTNKLGAEGPLVLFTWFGIAGLISKSVLPPYGKLAAQEQLLEGRFRARHAALIKNAEMVSFMRGEEPETKLLESAFKAIRDHQTGLLPQKFKADTVMGYLNKYFATVIGFLLTVRPVVTNLNGMGSASAGEIAAFFVSTRATLEGLASSVLAIFELQKRIGQLHGLASRVDTLFHGLEQREPILEKEIALSIANGNPPKRTIADELKFENVDVYKPDGVLLLKGLNITVPRGMRVIITGDNGCGKSSLFRVICGLWKLVGGNLYHPSVEKVYFLSQVNFVPVGSLRDVIVYPQQVKASPELDAKLREILKLAYLEDLKCDGVTPSLDDVLDWDVALSPGQKQRISFARLFYNAPEYAILDECTNGIAPDVEASLYKRCADMGMAVFSISHKIELKKLHDYELHFKADGRGGWEWIPLH